MNLCAWCKYCEETKRGWSHTKCRGSLVPPEILGEEPTKCQCKCREHKDRVMYEGNHAVNLGMEDGVFIIVG